MEHQGQKRRRRGGAPQDSRDFLPWTPWKTHARAGKKCEEDRAAERNHHVPAAPAGDWTEGAKLSLGKGGGKVLV